MTDSKPRLISESQEIVVDWDSFETVDPNAKLRPELKEKIQKWILSFYHLDPRYKILTFFNLVASEGADNVTDDSQDEQNSYIASITSSTTNAMNMSTSNGGSNRTAPSVDNSLSSAGSERKRQQPPLMQRPSARHIRPSTLSLLSSLFNATSILTVWRPCSNDAMRKMMEGTGVGKGLDIKGKSAKKGILSAFVPFMQIFHNDHKGEIQPITETAEMRIYYKDTLLRDHVFKVLQNFLKDGPPKKIKDVGECNSLTPRIDEGDEEEESAYGYNDYTSDPPLLPHKDPGSPSYLPDKVKLKKIKRYAKEGYYGIECCQRLFWYATIQDADISRAGTGTETGRPSLPGFQDANHKTLKVAQLQLPKPSPMPVVLQHKTLAEVKKDFEIKEEEKLENSDCHQLDACLDPRYLVMAYEEQGTIKPVVSDFDGFLLGWRREALWFGCNLPRDQEALMMWCVDHIEEILEDQLANPTNSDTWTIRWLDVMKNAAAEGYIPEMPEYGFGDPKSTSIMEHAALKLKSTGAVRHGTECFNYSFPQEIDEMFLLISDTLKPVPWKYVNVKDLQAILSKKIAEGFVFPLNPKWILCDPGWKKIYDELMASDALYADLSKDVWFPPYSGIRDRIEDIYRRHPNGFQRCTDPTIASRKLTSDKSSRSNILGRRQSATNILRDTLDDGLGSELTGNAFADLAQLELDDFVGRTSIFPKRKGQGSSMTIEELTDEDHSSSEARSGNAWRAPSKYEKRPSTVSHSSVASSSTSDKVSAPNSGRSIGTSTKNSKVGSSHHSSASTSSKSKGLGRILSRAAQSTRKMIAPSKSSKTHRPMPSFDAVNEDEQDSASVPNLSFQISESSIQSKLSPYQSPRATVQKLRYVPEPLALSDEDDASIALGKMDRKEKNAGSKEMNREKRQHFSKWNKIKNKNKLKTAKS